MKKPVRLCFLLMAICGTTWAQIRQLTGKITEGSSKEPIPGATVAVKQTTILTQSGQDGIFKLAIPARQGIVTIIIRSVGYKTREFTLTAGQTVLNAALEEDARSLNEVVAIGYQTVKRRDLNGAVSSVGAAQLQSSPLSSTSEALAGRLAGVQITTFDGIPGAAADVYIRGRGSITQSGSPLYVVDGVQLDNALNVLSPQDIESIDVLKDAASTGFVPYRSLFWE